MRLRQVPEQNTGTCTLNHCTQNSTKAGLGAVRVVLCLGHTFLPAWWEPTQDRVTGDIPTEGNRRRSRRGQEPTNYSALTP